MTSDMALLSGVLVAPPDPEIVALETRSGTRNSPRMLQRSTG
jgi:hypothetical protein